MRLVVTALLTLLILVATANALTFNIHTIATKLHKKYGIPQRYTEYVLTHAKVSKRVLYLMNHMPEKTMKFNEYSTLFVNKERLSMGVKFFKKHRLLLLSVEKQFGVDPYVITAILGIESYYGLEKPKFNALNVLYTLSKYMGKKYPYFTRELEIFIVYTYKNNINPFKIRSSYGGAIGIPQFIPSSIVEYGFDLDGGGLNLSDVDDAIGSVANYLARNGWRSNRPIATQLKCSAEICSRIHGKYYSPQQLKKMQLCTSSPIPKSAKGKIIAFKFRNRLHCWIVFHNFWVITRYNHSTKYAMSVFLLSKSIKKALTQ